MPEKFGQAAGVVIAVVGIGCVAALMISCVIKVIGWMF